MAGTYLYFEYNIPKAKACWDGMNDAEKGKSKWRLWTGRRIIRC